MLIIQAFLSVQNTGIKRTWAKAGSSNRRYRGLRAGYEGSKAQAFLKANWYHEFGGSGQVHLRDDEGDLFLDRDYGDTWFEYGLGTSVQLAPAVQLYADVERSSGGEFRKDWSWDAGIRWNF